MAARIDLPRPRNGGPVLIVAHRGNKVHCPENSLAAFARAVAEGADLLETDLRPSADGAFLCFHDATLERTSNGNGKIEELGLEEVRNYRLVHEGRVWEDERVPVLEELVRLCRSDVYLALELKSSRFDDDETCAALLAELDRLGMLRRTVLLALHRKRIERMNRLAPEIPGGVVTFSPWPLACCPLLGPIAPVLYMNPWFVRIAHSRGQFVCPLDVHPDSRVRYYCRLGVDALITDDPGATITALRNRSTRSRFC